MTSKSGRQEFKKNLDITNRDIQFGLSRTIFHCFSTSVQHRALLPSMHMKQPQILPSEIIENRIYVFRGQKVMLGPDLARLYGVEPRSLNQSVRRNIERFPEDFCFQLTEEEWKSLRSQIVILNPGRGGKGFRPIVFTEPGIAMLSSVLNSEKAIAVNIQIIRTFIYLRNLTIEHSDLRLRIDSLEKQYDEQFKQNRHRLQSPITKAPGPGISPRTRLVRALRPVTTQSAISQTGTVR